MGRGRNSRRLCWFLTAILTFVNTFAATATWDGIPIVTPLFTPAGTCENRITPNQYVTDNLNGGNYNAFPTSSPTSGWSTAGNNQEVLLIEPSTSDNAWSIAGQVATVSMLLTGTTIPAFEVRVYAYVSTANNGQDKTMQYIAGSALAAVSGTAGQLVTLDVYPRLPFSPGNYLGIVAASDVNLNVYLKTKTNYNFYPPSAETLDTCIGKFGDMKSGCSTVICRDSGLTMVVSFGIATSKIFYPTNLASLPSALFDSDLTTDWGAGAAVTVNLPALATSIVVMPSWSHQPSTGAGTRFSYTYSVLGQSTVVTIDTVASLSGTRGSAATINGGGFYYFNGKSVTITGSSGYIGDVFFSYGQIGPELTQVLVNSPQILEGFITTLSGLNFGAQVVGWTTTTWDVVQFPALLTLGTVFSPEKAFGPDPSTNNNATIAALNRQFKLRYSSLLLEFVGQLYTNTPTKANATVRLQSAVTANSGYDVVFPMRGGVVLVVATCGSPRVLSTGFKFSNNTWTNVRVAYSSSNTTISIAVSVWEVAATEPDPVVSSWNRCHYDADKFALTSQSDGLYWTGMTHGLSCPNLWCVNGVPMQTCASCICTFGWIGPTCETVGYGVGPFSYGYATGRTLGTAAALVVMSSFNFQFDALILEFDYTTTRACTIGLYVFRLINAKYVTIWSQSVTASGAGTFSFVLTSQLVVKQNDTIGFYDSALNSIPYTASSSISDTVSYTSAATPAPGGVGNAAGGVPVGGFKTDMREYSLQVNYAPPMCTPPTVVTPLHESCTAGMFATYYDGSTCTYSCDNGYILTQSASATRNCVSTFSNSTAQGLVYWDAPTPACKVTPPILAPLGSSNTNLRLVTNVAVPAGIAYPYTGGPSTYTTPLSCGLSLSSQGVLTGTPNCGPRTLYFNVSVSNSGGSSWRNATFFIVDAPLTSISYPQMIFIIGSVVTTVKPTPSSSGYNGLVWSISPSLPCLTFSAGEFSGNANCYMLNKSFTVSESNSGGGASTVVYINIVDNPPPSFSYLPVGPYGPLQSSVFGPIAPSFDAAPPAIQRYVLLSGTLPPGLVLNATSGVISGSPTVVANAVTLVIVAKNTGGQSPNSSIIITVNPRPPVLTIGGASTITLLCVNGTAITPQAVANSGGTAPINYPPLPTGLSWVGVNLTGTPTVVQPQMMYTISAANGGGSYTLRFYIQVIDKPMIISYPQTVAVYSIQSAITPDVLTVNPNGGVPVSGSVSPALPSGLSLDSASFTVSGTPTTVTASAIYTITITNSNGNVNLPLNITIIDIPPSGLTYPPTSFTFYRSISVGTINPTVNRQVVTWSIQPTLPAGLSFSGTSGQISGAPSATQAMTAFQITASNSGGSTSTTIQITVVNVPPTNLMYTPNTLLGLKGDPITPLTPSYSGDPVTSWGLSGTLPRGLSFNYSTGQFSGTPIEDTSAVVTVTAINSGGYAEASVTFSFSSSLVIVYPIQSITLHASIIISPQISYSTTLTWTVDPNPASIGLFFNTSTGVVTGSPNATGAYYFVVIGSGGANSAVAQLAITVVDQAPSGLSYPTPTTVTINKLFALPATVTGKVESWSMSPSIGVVVNNSGYVTGIPTQLGTSTFQITAVNAGGSSNTFTLTLNVVPSLPVLLGYSVPNPIYQSGVTINSNKPIVNGGPITIFAVRPTLPGGLSFNSVSGKIYGTPTSNVYVAGQSYTITAMNAAGNSTAVLFITVLHIAPNFIAFNPAPPSNGIYLFPVNVPVSVALSADGSTVQSWSLTPSTGDGLVIAPGGNRINGTPTVVSGIVVTRIVIANNTGGSTSASFVYKIVQTAPISLVYGGTISAILNALLSTVTPTVNAPIDSWSISPSLPSGLSFSTTTGAISGTPTTLSGPATYTVTATNSGGSISTTLTVSVSGAPPAFSYPQPIYSFIKGGSVSIAPIVTGGPVAQWSWSPDLPNGITFIDGSFVGNALTPTNNILSITVVATGSSGAQTFVGIGFNVTDVPPITISYPSMVTLSLNQIVSPIYPTVQGGRPDSFQIVGSLPGGLSFSGITGALYGVPLQTYSSTPITVTATNSGGSATTTFNIYVPIQPPLQLAYTFPFAAYTVGVPIVNNIPSAGGDDISSWILPSLPTGLTFGSDGSISGTPTVTSTRTSYTITAINAAGNSTTTIEIIVRQPPPSGLTYPIASTNFVGVPIAPIVPSFTGSVISFAIYPPLPPGLIFSTSNGTITGTPSDDAPQVSYDVTAFNNAGQVTQLLILQVLNPPPQNLVYTPQVLTVESYADISIIPDYEGTVDSFSISPVLPCFYLDSNTGILSGSCPDILPPTNFTITANPGEFSVDITIEVTEIAPASLSYPVANPLILLVNRSATSLTPFVRGVGVFTVNPALPNGININPTTGELIIDSVATAPMTTYTVTVTNSGGSTSTTIQLEIIAAENDFTFNEASPVYVQGTSITPNPADMGVTNCTSNSTLPPGLVLANNCRLTGTPSALAPLNRYVLTAIAGSTIVFGSIYIQVIDPFPIPWVYDLQTIQATINKTTTLSPVITGSTERALYYSIRPNLPQGLTLDSNTGQIMGAPVELLQATSFLVSKVNSAGQADASFSLSVVDVAPEMLHYPNTSVTYIRGVPISAVVPTVVGKNVMFDVDQLPPGLEIDPMTGTISGTPLSITNVISTVVVSNSGGSDYTVLSIDVLDLAPAGLGFLDSSIVCTQNVALSIQPFSSGGSITSYMIVPNLPAGLSLRSTTGAITGSPLDTGTYVGVLTGSNTGGSASTTITIVILSDCSPETSCNGHGICSASGLCVCDPPYSGDACEQCASDFYGPTCQLCIPSQTCSGNGICTSSGGCSCAPGFQGADCSECQINHYGPGCLPCACGATGECSAGRAGSGLCTCNDVKNTGPSCQYSPAATCNNQGVALYDGSCICAFGYAGLSCDVCAVGFFGPSCTHCDPMTTCSGNGLCNSDGTCACNQGFTGRDCGQCDVGYVNFPFCVLCNSGTCSGHGTCSPVGTCVCTTGYTGNNCALCAAGYGLDVDSGLCDICPSNYAQSLLQLDLPCAGRGVCASSVCSCDSVYSDANGECTSPTIISASSDSVHVSGGTLTLMGHSFGSSGALSMTGSWTYEIDVYSDSYIQSTIMLKNGGTPSNLKTAPMRQSACAIDDPRYHCIAQTGGTHVFDISTFYATVQPQIGTSHPTTGGGQFPISGPDFFAGYIYVGGVLASCSSQLTSALCTAPVGIGAAPITLGSPRAYEVGTYYYDPPAITSSSSSIVPTSGGIVNISGLNFGPANNTDFSVLLNGIALPSSSASLRSHTFTSLTVPPGNGGSIQVVMEVGSQFSRPWNLMYDTPKIISISGCPGSTPTGSPSSATYGCTTNTKITLTGSNFGTDPTDTGSGSLVILVGGAPCTSVTIVNPHVSVSCLLPAAPSLGIQLVAVSVSRGTSSSTANLVSYAGQYVGSTTLKVGGGSASSFVMASVGSVITVGGTGFPSTSTGVTVWFGTKTVPQLFSCGSLSGGTTSFQCTLGAGTGQGLYPTVVVSGVAATGTDTLSFPMPMVNYSRLVGDVWNVNGVSSNTQWGDTVELGGSGFGTILTNVRVTYGSVDVVDMFSCVVLNVSDTVIRCVTAPGTAIRAKLTFSVYVGPPGNAYTIRTNLVYQYNQDSAPVIGRVTGCTANGFSTINCPTTGNIPITIMGVNFAGNVSVSVGGKLCAVTTLTLPEVVVCTLPSGFGQNVGVVVRTSFQSAEPFFISYAVPAVNSIQGCTGSGTVTTNCARSGGTQIILTGTDFASTAITSVFVGGQLCTSLILASTTIRCNLPAGSLLNSRVTVFQGSVAATSVVTVSYAQCPAGQYSNSLTDTTCQNCPAGTFSFLPGQFSCTSCPGTASSAPGASTCSNCYPGSYLNGTACQICTAGRYSTQMNANLCMQCPPGTVSLKNSSTCQICPAGWFAQYPNSCGRCTNGTWSPPGQDYCLLCPAGRIADPTATVCTACLPGTYSYGDQYSPANCTLAQPGQYAPGYGNSEPLACPVGTMSGGWGASTCSDCLGGKYTTSTGSSSCQDCSSGLLQAQNCVACPLGSPSALSNGMCAACPLGSYNPPSESSSCLQCPAGRFGTSSTVQCDLCPQGKYTNVSGSLDCQTCPQGYAPDTPTGPGSKSCVICPTGRFSSSGLTCDVCPIGRAAGNAGQIACDQCSPGQFSNLPGAVVCTPCSAGRYTQAMGQQDCALCPIGRMAAQGNSATCDPCQPGEYQDGIGSTQCNPCAIGSFTTSNASVQCDLCLPGQYTVSTGTTECFDCLPGEYKTQSDTTCSACPTGTITATGGQTVCIPCGLGTYNQFTNATTCSLCDPGTYQDTFAQSSCPPCMVGKFASSPGTVTCSACPLGTQPSSSGSGSAAQACSPCDFGSYGRPGGTCDQCSTGSYTDSQGQISCTLCPPGTYGTGAGRSSCAPCAGGQYQDNPGSLVCKACPIGTDPSFTGLSVCMDCLAGKYSTGQGLPCVSCPPGSFSSNPKATTCATCDMGRYSASGAQVCVACPPGQISTANSSVCTACDSGKFQSSSGSSTCIPCPAGYIAPSQGTAVCTPCQPGTFTNDSVLQCTACPNHQVATVAGSSACSQCALGTYIAPGQQVTCTNCPAGRSSFVSGGTTCTVCLAGTAQGQAGETSCTVCQPGFYTSVPESGTCARCDAGTYNTQTNKTACLNCPAGSYQGETGLSFCTLCAPGHYSGVGSTECTKCSSFAIAPGNGTVYCEPCSSSSVASPDGTQCQCFAGMYWDPTIPNQTETNPSCFPCPVGAQCTQPGVSLDNMETLPGYWRPSTDNMDFYACRINAFCEGGRQSTCTEGRAGTVCGWCQPGWSGGTNIACTRCPPGGHTGASLARVILLALVFVLAAGLFDRWVLKKDTSRRLDLLMRGRPRELPSTEFHLTHAKLKNMKFSVGLGIDGVDEAKLLENNDVIEQNITIRESMRTLDREATITHQAKLAVTFFQLSAVLAFHRPIPWPSAFLSVASLFNIFNFDFLQVSQTDCLGGVNFYVKFLFRMLIPIAGGLFVLCTYTIPQVIRAFMKKKAGMERSMKLQEIYMKQRKLFYFTFYLLYTLVCSFLFEIFVCNKIEDKYYLAQDYTIICFDRRWNGYAALAGIMIVLYPIGVPLTFAARLYRNRNRLSTMKIRYELGFLYEVYHKNCWWFESLDMMHKLMITAILPFVSVDSQMNVGMGIVIAYAIIILIASPYKRRIHDMLHLLAQCSYFLIMLAGAYFKLLENIDPFQDAAMSVFLILDVLIFFIALAIALGTRVKQRVEALLSICGYNPVWNSKLLSDFKEKFGAFYSGKSDEDGVTESVSMPMSEVRDKSFL